MTDQNPVTDKSDSVPADDVILVETRGHIQIITLNRPDRLNAISAKMLAMLGEAMVAADKNTDIRVIILTGSGKGFCSGLDLIDVGQGGLGSQEGMNAGPRQLINLREAPINIMWHVDTPIICALNGAAAGYGMDLSLLCDMRIAAESAKMAAVTAKRNVVPESGGTWLLPRLIGWARTAEIYFRAKVLTARESFELGLVNTVVKDEELMATAMQWATEIAENAPLAVQTTKRMMRMGLEESYDTAVDHLMAHLMTLFGTEDFQEGVKAFVERRKPNFTGR